MMLLLLPYSRPYIISWCCCWGGGGEGGEVVGWVSILSTPLLSAASSVIYKRVDVTTVNYMVKVAF